MQSRKLSDRLVGFVEHVKTSRTENGRKLTVLDLRVECRTQRLTEYSDWPVGELDLIEQEAACYGDETDLADLTALITVFMKYC